MDDNKVKITKTNVAHKAWLCLGIVSQLALLIGIGFAFYYVVPALFRLLIQYNSLGGS